MNTSDINIILSGIAIATVLVPSVCDVNDRKIAAFLTYLALFAGLCLHIWFLGWKGLYLAGTGTLFGGGIFLVMFQLGWIEARDVKLIAAVGALLNIHRIVPVLLFTALAGGLILSGQVLVKLAFGKKKTFPYGTSIAAGTILTIVLGL